MLAAGVGRHPQHWHYRGARLLAAPQLQAGKMYKSQSSAGVYLMARRQQASLLPVEGAHEAWLQLAREGQGPEARLLFW